ncbi:MAG: HAD-IA family hydrolase [Candidatus Taylorbacteria bacterium]|nr:HAD-IA family hydrolase [Candidatus Taylorbacteria bacterium]
MIKAVAFDYGDVIELHEGGGVLTSTAELLGVPVDEFRKVYFEHNHLANVNNLNWYEMFNKVLSTFNVNKEKEKEILSMLEERNSKRKINIDLVAMFPKLRQLGFKVGILSNSASGLRKRLNQNGIAELADVIVISGEIGFQKPHKEAFQVLFEKLNLKPEEVIFVDDTSKSLEKAHEIGYVPILFKNNEQLKADLITAGVSF